MWDHSVVLYIYLVFSGESGNFILSTSYLGFRVIGDGTGGSTAPMCFNGYGVFDRLANDAEELNK